MAFLRLLLPSLLLLLSAACSDDGAPSVDADADADAGPAEAGVDGPAPDTGPQVAPQIDPTPLPISEWMVAMAVSPDPMRAALEQGTFSYPAAGWDQNKMHWSARKPGENGSLGTFPPGLAYAVARVKLEATDRLMILSEPTARVWLGKVPYPGDIYASHKIRVPLLAGPRESLLVLQILGGRAEPRAELWTTPDELHLNLDDLTTPDLVQGDSSELCLGVPVLNLTTRPALEVTARVTGSDELEESVVSYPALAAGAVTQVAFKLKPKGSLTVGSDVEATLRLESPSLAWIYERHLTLKVVSADGYYRRTRISGVDRSCQYYGVAPPTGFDPTKKYALVLSLHGAGVKAINQVKAYSRKDWAFIVAPTNRRPFGFDWEVWGRLDGIEALDHAMQSFPIDPTRVYLTGHSMGGHGTWHLGVMHPGRFAVIAPSAGWSSFYSYAKDPKPSGVFARTQAHSDTNSYLGNLKRRGVYILHGGADSVVPPSEGQSMFAAVQQVTTDAVYHEEPGVGHWWDSDKTKEGTDCVDWDPLFAFLKARTLDPVELTFDFKTPAPWVSSTHSFVTIRSQLDAMQDSSVSATHSGGTVTLTTSNVRGMVLDGDVLKAGGVSQVLVDGKSFQVAAGKIEVGPQDGKAPGAHGPFSELFYRPFCLVYPDDAKAAFERYVAYLVSSWAVVGNGHACAIPLSQLATAPDTHNLIFVGIESSAIPKASLPFSWSPGELSVGGKQHTDAALYLTFPHEGRIGGAIYATSGSEHLLFRVQPFTSRLVIPDYMVLSSGGVADAGLFDASWK